MSLAYTAPGVYIQELPADSRAVVGVSTSRTAFVGRALRGPVDRPILIGSFAEFERTFGGLWSQSALGHAVAQFFINGGAEALIVRVVSNVPTGPGVEPARSASAAVTGTAQVLEAANPGAWGSRLRARVFTTDLTVAEVAAGAFHLELREVDAAGNPVASETFMRVTFTPGAARALDRILEHESALARVRAPMAAGNPTVASLTFTNGRDGDPPRITEDVLGSEAARTGIHALRRADLFNLLCLPMDEWSDADGAVTALWNAAARLCEQSRAMLLVDPPSEWSNAAAAAAAGASLPITRTTNAALYYPRIIAPDPLQEGRLREFPPSGAVAGVIARTDAARGVWKAPAGTEATLVGVPDLDVRMSDLEQGELNRVGINGLRRFPVIGSVVWGARTLFGADVQASQWKYLPVRRLALYLHESLYRGSQWAVFEPNDEPLWAQLRLSLGSFMHSLFRQGAFAGASAREAYFVQCDRTTTPPADVARGVVNVIVGFAPLRPTEFVIIKLQQIADQPA